MPLSAALGAFGDVAQWESICFASRGSRVRIPSSPPLVPSAKPAHSSNGLVSRTGCGLGARSTENAVGRGTVSGSIWTGGYLRSVLQWAAASGRRGPAARLAARGCVPDHNGDGMRAHAAKRAAIAHLDVRRAAGEVAVRTRLWLRHPPTCEARLSLTLLHSSAGTLDIAVI